MGSLGLLGANPGDEIPLITLCGGHSGEMTNSKWFECEKWGGRRRPRVKCDRGKEKQGKITCASDVSQTYWRSSELLRLTVTGGRRELLAIVK
jgi:hypothetical protein